MTFYHKIPWFYQDFKSESQCLLNLYSIHVVSTGPITRDQVKSSRMRNETPLQL